ncbi:MAG: LON peptidase substrate-binding domain-containing protein [Burkholderiaceae bacterium]|nr:LON peptidase substrate-binding domain-containing protein [Burkholderiaceae bacterium]
MDDAGWIPLFPLKTVLFPGGVLPLRVFETRYVDMVRACMKSNAPFGVVAIRSGAEVGAAAAPHAVGTLAHIIDWDMADLGVLLLNTRGGERFRILDTRTLPNQLIEARTEAVPEGASPVAVQADGSDALSVCANVLRVVIDDLLQRVGADADDGFISPFPEPHRLDDAGWVANRWSEMLPIPLDERQQLLELPDPATRLQKVAQYLQENGVI